MPPTINLDPRISELSLEQRREVHFALLERRELLQDISKKSLKAHTPHPVADKRELLYGDAEVYDEAKARNRTVPGLISLFAPEIGAEEPASPQTDAFDTAAQVEEKKRKGRGSKKDREHVESTGVGGGHPAGETAFLDRYGNQHATAEEASAANERPDPALERSGGIGAEPAEPTAKATLALVAGTPSETTDAEFEIISDESREHQIERTSEGRCVGCKTFRGEPHDPACAEVSRVAAANQKPAAAGDDEHGTIVLDTGGKSARERLEEAWDTPQRKAPETAAEPDPTEELRRQAKNATPSTKGPIPVDQSTSMTGAPSASGTDL